MRSRSKITIMAKGTLNNTCNYDSCFCPIPVFFFRLHVKRKKTLMLTVCIY